MNAQPKVSPLAVQRQHEFCEQLQCGRTTFHKLLNSDPNFPKRFKIGGYWVYDVADCNAYIQRCAEESM